MLTDHARINHILALVHLKEWRDAQFREEEFNCLALIVKTSPVEEVNKG